MKKNPSTLLTLGCCILLSLFAPPETEAGTTYLRVNTPLSGDWSDALMWDPGSGYPITDGDQAHFNGSTTWRYLKLKENDDPTLLAMDVRGYWDLRPDPDSGPRSVHLRATPGPSEATPFLDVGSSKVGDNATGRLKLGAGVTLTLEGGRFLVGTPEVTITNPAPRVGLGVVIIEAGAILNIGTEAHRTQWLIAQHYASRPEESGKHSSVTAEAAETGGTNAVISAWLTELQVGNNHSLTDQNPEQARIFSGTLDLSAATVTTFNVRDNVVIGSGAHHIRSSNGTVLLPKLNGKIGGNLLVGDTPVESSGKLTLNGSHLEVEGDVNIDLTGRVRVTISEKSAGLRLSENSALIIQAEGSGVGDETAGYFIDFTNVTLSGDEFLYGLAWEGDHLAYLATLINSYSITWINGPDGLTAGLYYDSGANLTYIGFDVIPEPSAVSLLAGSIALLGWLGRRRLKKPVA